MILGTSSLSFKFVAVAYENRGSMVLVATKTNVFLQEKPKILFDGLTLFQS